MSDDVKIHPTAEVSPKAQIGAGTRVWHQVQIREGARIGRNCILGKGTYVDFDVHVGDNCKIQNGVFLYHGVTVEDGVFLGPGVILTNDKLPRAITPDGNLKEADDWVVGPITIRHGASLGTGAIVLPNVTVGEWALVGAGAVVTHDVPDHGLVAGNPARLIGYVCKCGQRLRATGRLQGTGPELACPACGWKFTVNSGGVPA